MRRSQGAPREILRIAHRGASLQAPENTLAAFETAIRQGIDAIEFDGRLTTEGVPVVVHDDRLERTTDGRGPVAEASLQSIRRLDAGSWFATRFRGERVPTLAEALECASDRCGVNIEIKTEPRRGRSLMRSGPGSRADEASLASAVARELKKRARWSRPPVISSFSRTALEAVRALLPRTHLGFLVSRSTRGVAQAHRALSLQSLHPHLRLASRRRIAAAHRRGLLVLVWPVNDPEALRRLMALGVDGVMTDDPLLFHRVLDTPSGRT